VGTEEGEGGGSDREAKPRRGFGEVPHADPVVRRRNWQEFLDAAAFLTRLPVGGDATMGPLAASGWAFPLVGAGIGALAAAVFLGAQLVGCAAIIAAPLAVLAGIALTGALHEDGLADAADAFGAGDSRTQILAIMRDSRHGTYGVVALVASFGLRAAALATIAEPIRAGLALVAAHAASRALLPAAMQLLRPARPDGLGATAGRPGAAVALIAAIIGAAIALGALGPPRGAAALALAALVVAAAAMLARRRIGGYTGDVLGAFQQIGEIVMLLAAAAQ